MLKRVLAILAFFCCTSAVGQEDAPWIALEKSATGEPILEYRLQAQDSTFRYIAVRGNLDYFRLELVSAKQLNATTIDYQSPDLRGLAQRLMKEAGKPLVALVGAGFPTSIGSTLNVGLLRIDGIEDTAFQVKGPSAVLCLHSPNPAYSSYGFQVPVFYRPGEDEGQLGIVANCRDAVQVGPRILEDPGARNALDWKSHDYTGPRGTVAMRLGIEISEMGRTPYPRTVFAVDDPHRPVTADKRFGGRNAYLIVTLDSVHLYEVQTLLASSEFYGNPDYYPAWAVNLVGGVYAGIVSPLLLDRGEVLDSNADQPGQGGNVDIVLSSAIALVRREQE